MQIVDPGKGKNGVYTHFFKEHNSMSSRNTGTIRPSMESSIHVPELGGATRGPLLHLGSHLSVCANWKGNAS